MGCVNCAGTATVTLYTGSSFTGNSTSFTASFTDATKPAFFKVDDFAAFAKV